MSKETMIKEYTEIWNEFQFKSPTYLDGHFEPYEFALVKWQNCEPHEVIEWETGKRKISTRYCFVVGSLIWNAKDPGFEFKSCGLRYLEHRIDGLEEFILNFAEQIEKKLIDEFD